MPAGWHALMGINTCWHRSRHMPILLCANEKAPFPLPFQHTQSFLRASIDLCVQENLCCRQSCLTVPGVLWLKAMTESRMRANWIPIEFLWGQGLSAQCHTKERPVLRPNSKTTPQEHCTWPYCHLIRLARTHCLIVLLDTWAKQGIFLRSR